MFPRYSVNTICWTNVGLMLVHRLRRWINNKPTLAEHLVFVEYVQADDVYGPVREDCHAAVQSQKAVSAHFTSEQVLPFGFAGQRTPPKWHPYIAQVYREKRREISQRVAPLCGFPKPRGLWSGSSAIVPAPSGGGGGNGTRSAVLDPIHFPAGLIQRQGVGQWLFPLRPHPFRAEGSSRTRLIAREWSRSPTQTKVKMSPNRTREDDMLPPPLGYARVYLPLYKVADTPFHIQGDGMYFSTFAPPNDHLKENEKPLQKKNFFAQKVTWTW